MKWKKKGDHLSSSWTCNEHVIKKSKSLNVWNGKKEVISWVHEHVMNMPLENLNHLMLKMEKKKVISSSWTCNEHAIKKSKSLDTRNGEKKGNQPVWSHCVPCLQLFKFPHIACSSWTYTCMFIIKSHIDSMSLVTMALLNSRILPTHAL